MYPKTPESGLHELDERQDRKDILKKQAAWWRRTAEQRADDDFRWDR